MTFIYEDELPEDISDVEYDNWFKQSWVEGVRIGPRLHFSTITISELIKKFGLLRGPWKKTDWGYRCNVKSISPNFK